MDHFWLFYAFALLPALGAAWALGAYFAGIGEAGASRLERFFAPLERPLLALVGPRVPMDWKAYSLALVWSNALMTLLCFGVLRLQGVLPLNPAGVSGMEPMQAFNTAVSFVTNTSWQSYAGEVALSPFAQMAGIVFGMFAGAASGLCAGFAFMRALAGRADLGNFYTDFVRCLVRFLLPVAALATLFFAWRGVPSTLSAGAEVVGPQGTAQHLPLGPVAAFDAIKHLGHVGGGYYGQNSAHPLENPTPLSAIGQIALMLVPPMALVFAFGRLIGNRRQARIVIAGMGVVFLALLALGSWAEVAGNPRLSELGLASAPGNLEGKEWRFGQALTALFVSTTTASSTGSVACMHDSLTPLGGLVPLVQMLLADVYGGLGVGLMTYVLYGVLAVFLTGLMVGRTPEFLGKKIEQREIALASLAILTHPLIVLVPAAVSIAAPWGLSSLTNAGPHGLSEILYAFSSAAATNGSAFAGLDADTPWYNLSLGTVMLLGRYPLIVLLLALAGSLTGKPRLPEGPSTLRTDTPLFGAVWLAVVLVVGALSFFPLLALGPIAEHLAMIGGRPPFPAP